MAAVTRYGLTINQPDASETDCLLLIELEAIRLGGRWNGNGEGLFKHFLNVHHLLWPEDEQHRWFKLGLRGIVENTCTILLGCSSSGKSYLMAVHALITFFCFKDTSLSLISSTDIRSMEIRIWGRGVKWLFNRARARFDWLPGIVLDSKMAIVPDEISEDGEFARELNKGLICVPCISGGKFVGMSKFQGIKPPNSPGKNDGRLAHYGDEAATMQSSFLDAYANWMVNANFKGIMAGNPTDILDPLCIASEPVGGWDCFTDSGKTQTWNSKWYGAFCIAYDGRDTPNNDEPKDRYSFLANSNYVKSLEATHGKDSWQVYVMGIGKPSKGMVSNRVITMAICDDGKAFEDVIWMGEPLTEGYAIDPAYGGGDRCVGGRWRFGKNQDGITIMDFDDPEIIPIRPNSEMEPEDQIATFVHNKCFTWNIQPENVFYDSFGRGTLGFSFAKVFGDNCPVPIDSGSKCTGRPVRFDLYINDKGKKRLKRCDEEYSKFITEMWFSVREAIISKQIRNLTRAVALEGQLRLYSVVKGNRTEVETKDDLKKRIGKSPDLFDWCALSIEGARRLGFQINRIGLGITSIQGDKEKWLREMAKKRDDWSTSKRLVHA